MQPIPCAIYFDIIFSLFYSTSTLPRFECEQCLDLGFPSPSHPLWCGSFVIWILDATPRRLVQIWIQTLPKFSDVCIWNLDLGLLVFGQHSVCANFLPSVNVCSPYSFIGLLGLPFILRPNQR